MCVCVQMQITFHTGAFQKYTHASVRPCPHEYYAAEKERIRDGLKNGTPFFTL